MTIPLAAEQPRRCSVRAGTSERVEPDGDQVVVSGRASVELVGLGAVVEARPGTLLRIPGGTLTRWTTTIGVELLDVHEGTLSYRSRPSEAPHARPFRPRRTLT